MKVKCPVCKAETVWEENKFRPFCSERCKVIDIGSWVDEKYSVTCDNVVDKDEEEVG